MENCSSSHHYDCSTSLEIPCLLGNLKGDYHYKRQHIKSKHNIHCINIPINLSVYFVGDYNAQ